MSCELVTYGLYYVDIYSLYTNNHESFYMNGCQILSSAFSATIEMIMEKQSLQVVGWEN